MNPVKAGLRRKWQATVKHREPPSSAACSANDEWERQWKGLWRDIGLAPFAACMLSHSHRNECSKREKRKLFCCFSQPPMAEGGQDFEALVDPIAQHDKEVFCTPLLRHVSMCCTCNYSSKPYSSKRVPCCSSSTHAAICSSPPSKTLSVVSALSHSNNLNHNHQRRNLRRAWMRERLRVSQLRRKKAQT